MDFSKLVEFLQAYPLWFRGVVTLWIFLSALVLSGVLLVPRTPAAEAAPVPQSAIPAAKNNPEGSEQSSMATKPAESQVHPETDPTTAQEIPNSISTSYAAYVNSRKKLADRFVQLEQFEHGVVGTTITWPGIVDNISGISNENGRISFTLDSPEVEGDYFFADFPPSLRTASASLRKGDKVRINGSISRTGRHPLVSGKSFDLL